MYLIDWQTSLGDHLHLIDQQTLCQCRCYVRRYPISCSINKARLHAMDDHSFIRQKTVSIILLVNNALERRIAQLKPFNMTGTRHLLKNFSWRPCVLLKHTISLSMRIWITHAHFPNSHVCWPHFISLSSRLLIAFPLIVPASTIFASVFCPRVY